MGRPNQPAKFTNRIVAGLPDLIIRLEENTLGIFPIFRLAVRRFSKVHGAEAAGSAAFFTIFSLFPLLLVLVSFGRLVFGREVIIDQVTQIARLTIPVSPELLVTNMEEALEEQGAIGLLSFISLIWSGSAILTTLIRNIDRAWPGAPQRSFLHGRLAAFAIIVLLFGLLFVSSLTFTAFNLIVQFNQTLTGENLLDDNPMWRIFTSILPFMVRVLIFTMLYRWIPHTRVAWLAAFGGAIFAAIAWEIATRLFVLYLQSGIAQYRLVYGSLGTIVALMVWIYIGNLIILFSAHLSSAIMHLNKLPDTAPA